MRLRRQSLRDSSGGVTPSAPIAATTTDTRAHLRSLQRAVGNRGFARLVGPARLQRSWVPALETDDGLDRTTVKKWVDDERGNKRFPPVNHRKFEELLPDIQDLLRQRLPFKGDPSEFWISEFVICEVRGRRRYESLLTAPTLASAEASRRATLFADEYKTFTPSEEGLAPGTLRAHHRDVDPDSAHHDIVIKPQAETVEVWMTAGGKQKEPLHASEVIYQTFRRAAPQARLRHLSHCNVISGSGTAVYGHLVNNGRFPDNKRHDRAPVDARQTSEEARVFYAYLGTDNGSTVFGLLNDHRQDLGIRGLESIEADAGTITYHFA